MRVLYFKTGNSRYLSVPTLVYDKEEKMNKSRVEAFTDAVVAIILTIMVLEFKTPETAKWTGIMLYLPSYFLERHI